MAKDFVEESEERDWGISEPEYKSPAGRKLASLAERLPSPGPAEEVFLKYSTALALGDTVGGTAAEIAESAGVPYARPIMHGAGALAGYFTARRIIKDIKEPDYENGSG